MSIITCTDAIVYWDGIVLPETNNVSIKIERDLWEIKPYYATPETAYVLKQPTWEKWSVSLTAYYDGVAQYVENGQSAQLLIYPTRSMAYYWSALAVARSVEQSVSSAGFSEISATFESDGSVEWHGIASIILTETGYYIVTENGNRIAMQRS